MRIEVKKDEELNESNLVPDGVYDFTVTKAEEKRSFSGNEMIKLTLQIWDKSGREHYIFCHLLNAMPHLLKHFCEATNLMDNYNSGILTHYNCENASGKCKVIAEKGKPVPIEKRYDPSSVEYYPDKNIVKDFIKYEGKKQAPQNDIPF